MTDLDLDLDELEKWCSDGHYIHKETGTILDIPMSELVRRARLLDEAVVVLRKLRSVMQTWEGALRSMGANNEKSMHHANYLNLLHTIRELNKIIADAPHIDANAERDQLAEAYRHEKSQVNEALDIIQELRDIQNGCPLPTWEKQFNAINKRADAFLGRIDEVEP